MSEVEMMRKVTEKMLYDAVVKTIEAMGIEQFKNTSFFLSNEKAVELKRAA